MPAARAAIAEPEHVDRLVLFAPITSRATKPVLPSLPAWSDVTIEAQHARFTEDVPSSHAPLLVAFDRWAPAYPASDPNAASRTPPAVRIPHGPRADNADAWAGYLAWNPAELTRPLAIVRGAWDSLCTGADVAGLLAMATSAPERLDTRLDAGTHLMHLETGRRVRYESVGRALKGEKP